MKTPREISCEEFIERVSAYALSALDDSERHTCARHIARVGRHRGCHQALADAEAVTARLSEVLPENTPPPELWRAIELQIKH